MEIKNALPHDLSFVVGLLINLCCYLINILYLYFLPSQLDFMVFEDGNYVLCFRVSPDVRNSALQKILSADWELGTKHIGEQAFLSGHLDHGICFFLQGA